MAEGDSSTRQAAPQAHVTGGRDSSSTDLRDDDVRALVRRVAHGLGETEEVAELRPGSLHPVWRAGTIVIRLETGETAKDVRARLANCRRMVSGGVSFVQPATAEPIAVSGWDALLATAWHYVEPVHPLDLGALGAAVRTLHRFEHLEHDEPTLTERLARAVDLEPGLDPAVAARFRSMIPVFEAELSSVGWYDLPTATSHGDLFTKNVIPAGPGRVHLCDADFLGVRPVESDLGLLHHEIGGDDRWEQFVDGYGRAHVPPVERLAVGLRAATLNWAIYVLERRRHWVDYIDDLSKGSW